MIDSGAEIAVAKTGVTAAWRDHTRRGAKLRER